MYQKYLKRVLDVLLSLCSIAILLAVFVIIAFLVRIKMGKPVIFCQERPGRNEKIFKLYKFRTMTDKKDEDGKILADNLRLTKFGQFLRSSSLDELPELFNVLKGDMSIIGPRPLLVQYLPLYNVDQRHRHDVRPGLSGLAQVNGRNTLKWEEKFDYDIKYINNITFLGDMKIIIMTLKKALIREGINSETAATMEVFQGTYNENSVSSHTDIMIEANEDGK